jgi:hypothetical protein
MPHKILTKPLPEILDELEDWVKRVEEATKKAEVAALEAKQAARLGQIADFTKRINAARP